MQIVGNFWNIGHYVAIQSGKSKIEGKLFSFICASSHEKKKTLISPE